MPAISDETKRLLALLNGFETGTGKGKDKDWERLRINFGYPGSKGDQLEHILPNLPKAQTFVDVCGGTGSISLNIDEYPLMIFNDKCSGVTAFFRCLQQADTLQKLSDRIHIMIYSKEEWLFCADSWDDKTNDLVERAARWFYMVHCSFSTKGSEWGRARKPGGGKFDRFDKISKNIHFLHERVSKWMIENDDWSAMCDRYDSPQTVFYFDPSYFDCTPGMYRHEMSKATHRRMLDRIHELHGFVAISGYPNKLYDTEYDWDNRIEWKHTKTTLAGIACEENNYQGHTAGDTRVKSTEVLWIKEFR